jgi:hypothetical protein
MEPRDTRVDNGNSSRMSYEEMVAADAAVLAPYVEQRLWDVAIVPSAPTKASHLRLIQGGKAE